MPLPQHASAHSLSLQNKYSLWAEREKESDPHFPRLGNKTAWDTSRALLWMMHFSWLWSALEWKISQNFLQAGGLGEKNNVAGGAEKVHLLLAGGCVRGDWNCHFALCTRAGFYGTACRCENFSRWWIIGGLKASMSEVRAWAANYIRIIRAAAAVKINNQSDGCWVLWAGRQKARERRPVSSKHSSFHCKGISNVLYIKNISF